MALPLAGALSNIGSNIMSGFGGARQLPVTANPNQNPFMSMLNMFGGGQQPTQQAATQAAPQQGGGSFFDNLMSSLGGQGAVGKALPLAGMLSQGLSGILASREKPGFDWAKAGEMANLQKLGATTQAIANPNDPLYKRLVEEETKARRGDFLRTLKTTMEQDRRNRAMGRGSILGAEREDEALYNTINRMNEPMQEAGRLAAQQRLGQTYDAQRGLVPMQRAVSDDFAQQQEAAKQRRYFTPYALGGMMQAIPKMETGIYGGVNPDGSPSSRTNQNQFRGGYTQGGFY